MGLQVTESADYDPFGYIFDGTHFVNTGALSNYNLYQGENSEFDPISGWNRFSSRGNYDSRIGRWYSSDPASQYPSGYVGMGNTPINAIDKDGNFIGLLAAFFTDEAIAAGLYAGITNVAFHADQVEKNPGEALGYFGAGYLGGASSVALGGLFAEDEATPIGSKTYSGAGVNPEDASIKMSYPLIGSDAVYTPVVGKIGYGQIAGVGIGGLATVGVDNYYGNINGWDWRSFSSGAASVVNAKHDVNEIAEWNGLGEPNESGITDLYHSFVRSGFQNLAKGFGSSNGLYRSGLIDFITGGLTSIPDKNKLFGGRSNMVGNFSINYFNEYLSDQIKSAYFGPGNPVRDASYDSFGDSAINLYFNLSKVRYGLF
jgi:RHS repeat-associated protein